MLSVVAGYSANVILKISKDIEEILTVKSS